MQIWDAAAGKKLSMMEGHTARVGENLACPAASMGHTLGPGQGSPVATL